MSLAPLRSRPPVVDLPLGATEDRVIGTLDLETGHFRAARNDFSPALLARANRGFLYIDEVNLLEDHLVDLLLDVAASGENVVEREGLSIRHPARFVLVGSGNPEEGELRPQLLDRFGLSVEIGSPEDIQDRVEVIRRRDAFDRDPEAFLKDWAELEVAARKRIVAARKALPKIETPDDAIEAAARLCQARWVGWSARRIDLDTNRARRRRIGPSTQGQGQRYRANGGALASSPAATRSAG